MPPEDELVVAHHLAILQGGGDVGGIGVAATLDQAAQARHAALALRVGATGKGL